MAASTVVNAPKVHLLSGDFSSSTSSSASSYPPQAFSMSILYIHSFLPTSWLTTQVLIGTLPSPTLVCVCVQSLHSYLPTSLLTTQVFITLLLRSPVCDIHFLHFYLPLYYCTCRRRRAPVSTPTLSHTLVWLCCPLFRFLFAFFHRYFTWPALLLLSPVAIMSIHYIPTCLLV